MPKRTKLAVVTLCVTLLAAAAPVVALAGQGDFPGVTCNAPWVSAVIETDGAVRPCFFQPTLGNVRAAGSLGAVLNTPEAIRWRAGLDTARNAICRKCVCSLALRRREAPSLTAPNG